MIFDQTTAVYAALIVQAATGLLLTVLLLSFYRHYQKEYLKEWAVSWLVMSLSHLTGAAGLWLASYYPAAAPLRVILTLVSGATGYLQIAYLIFGCFELAYRRPLRRTYRRAWLGLLAATGMALSLFYLTTASATVERYFFRNSIRSLALAISFVAAAFLIQRARLLTRGIGFRILSIAFILYAIEHLQRFVLGALWLFANVSFTYAPYLGFLEFALQALMGIGMLTALLEDEREATLLATRQIEHLAYHDALTGLPNRAMFLDRLILATARASRYHHGMAVLFLDLDRFKEINDSLGHTLGDQLLKAVAERVRSCTREADTLARFGGDEFTLLIDQIASVDDPARVARKIIETLKIPYQIGDRELFISTSIGISIYPDDGSDADTLVRNADTAMYRAKDQGRDTYQLYAPAMNAQALERLALEQMLRKALTQQELVLFYQPLISTDTRRVTGAEALIRWNHPELGLLSPTHFIATAETSGLILPIGAWVLETACRQAKAWQKKFGPHFSIAVNLSARQFQQPELIDHVKNALAGSGLEARCLELEITESSAMKNAENTLRTLSELKALGVRISMDDFGTGYSSLSYLKRFPIDTLKLDQSFVRDLSVDASDDAIAAAVISMAHTLKLKVVAEGVENAGQLSFLEERRCDLIQGFYFSAPLPPDRFETFVRVGSTPSHPILPVIGKVT